MKSLQNLLQKQSLMVIGLMSGTSADGMDAVLTEIRGQSIDIQVRQLAFVTLPYRPEERKEILRLASGGQGGSHDLALFSFYLGQKSLEACLAVCRKAGLSPSDVDLVGSHGQTLWHIPSAESYLDRSITATLQLGEPSVIAEGLGCPVVSDFRVRDMAAGGLGAPLVPYSEFLLYRKDDQCIGLQNIGGIANLTVIPKQASLDDVFAFDTGPGNMVIDRLAETLTHGTLSMDLNGKLAGSGQVSAPLLAWLLEDPFLAMAPPKTTGREAYGEKYVRRLLAKAEEEHLKTEDILATATALTAESIRIAICDHCTPKPDCLIVGGGGTRNPVLMDMLRSTLDLPVCLNEDLGFDSDAKEAVAFAILASECIHEVCNNVPRATGAGHPVVMGKITL